jgi:hypothetical protein
MAQARLTDLKIPTGNSAQSRLKRLQRLPVVLDHSVIQYDRKAP